MHQAHYNAITSVPDLASLRRWTLVTLVGGVIGLGVFGIGLLLFASGYELVSRVFGTIAVLVIASGLALAAVMLTERRLVHPLYFWVIFAGAVSFSSLDVVAIWWQFGWSLNGSWWLERALGSSFSFFAAGVLSIPVAVALRAGRSRDGWLIGIGVILLAFLWTMTHIWLQLPASLWFHWTGSENIMLALWLVAFVPPHAAIVTTLDPKGSPSALRLATVSAGATLGIYAAVFALVEPRRPDMSIRALAILGIITTSLTLTAAVMSRMRAARRRRALGAALPIELTCPACRSAQTLTTGDSACSQCGCLFSIRITPRECLSCGYSLAGLRGRVCPECGRGF